jgi:hypothetical protein
LVEGPEASDTAHSANVCLANVLALLAAALRRYGEAVAHSLDAVGFYQYGSLIVMVLLVRSLHAGSQLLDAVRRGIDGVDGGPLLKELLLG